MYAYQPHKGKNMQATDRISLRTTPHAKAIIEQASNIMGVSMSHFIITTMYQKSLELLNNTPVWYASDADKALMNQLLQDPTPPNQALQDLLTLSETITDNT